ncbi:HNH endonuclease signature motif containing protein [Herbaspirillum sp. ST 5-3]|uniref:HNH endonuclease n=1 Tax=Oxalobacteraceae TaxID=75682 RepID=UPI001FFF7B57|nr:HNH endonuclease signature motif containing protein [Herbaspirillum sp. ST 5-3]
MTNAKRKLQMLKPRLQVLDPMKARGIKTLKQKQEANGRTLALDSAAWRKLRASVLADEPLCRHCQALGRVTPATDVDHIDNDPSNNRRDNLQALCHECHSRKTNADMGRRVSYGCDADGIPLNPNHPWRIDYEREKSPDRQANRPTGTSSFNANRENEP